MKPMQSMFPRRRHQVPSLNVASMPDLIFTVLFFFMIVTHMRSDEGIGGEYLYRTVQRRMGCAVER